VSDFPPPPNYGSGQQLPPPPPGQPPGYPIPPNYSYVPPGYVPYGGGYGYPQQPTQPVGGLSRALVILLSIAAAFTVARGIALILLHSKAVDAITNPTNFGVFQDATGLYSVVTLLGGLFSLAGSVVLIIWTFRLARNVQARGRQLRFGPGASIAINILGGCTLFILNLLMWQDLWKASDPSMPAGDQGWQRSSVSPVVGLWFVAQLLATFGGVVVGVGAAIGGIGRSTTTELADRLNGKFGWLGVISLISVLSVIAQIALVRQLGARHQKMTGEI
jgi:ABC-type multidrug transport system fused ATPase/permease subunit